MITCATSFQHFRKENYSFRRTVLTIVGVSKWKKNPYTALSQIVLLQKLWAEVMALKKYYSLLLLEAEEELSLLNFYKKIFPLQTVPGLYLPPIFCRNPLPTTNCCKVIFRRISFRYRCRNGVRKLMRRMGRIRSIWSILRWQGIRFVRNQKLLLPISCIQIISPIAMKLPWH